MSWVRSASSTCGCGTGLTGGPRMAVGQSWGHQGLCVVHAWLWGRAGVTRGCAWSMHGCGAGLGSPGFVCGVYGCGVGQESRWDCAISHQLICVNPQHRVFPAASFKIANKLSQPRCPLADNKMGAYPNNGILFSERIAVSLSVSLRW